MALTRELHLGDCLQVMKTLHTRSVDAVVTDPPYGIDIAGMHWDRGVPGKAFWAEMRRLAKPDAYLLAFGGTREYHHLGCAIEDAGWEIRDCIAWLWIYAEGMAKSKSTLKPSWEPIIVARKKGKLESLNIDACRIPADDFEPPGRFPPNLVMVDPILSGDYPDQVVVGDTPDVGDRSRFFMIPKAKGQGKRGPDGVVNDHPTVKPVELMRWLVRLVTPVGGTVLDPFMGSGSTCLAAEEEGFGWIGIERDKAYMKIAEARIEALGLK